jgi:class 3 adenylate cyclase/alpha-beta hydrolase superfamily lysophospholipase
VGPVAARLHPGKDASVDTPETRYAKTLDGVHIAYRVVGAGPIDLVWAPGTVSHVELYWEEPGLVRFIGHLASFSRLMVFDKRGTGMSDHATEAATLEERMDDIRAVMDACDSERAVILGVSEGAPMCALFAATYPERTVGVILCGGFAKGLPAEDYPWVATREEQLADIAREEDSWGTWTDDELIDFAPSMAGDARFLDWLRRLFRMGASPGASRALSLMNMDVDITNVLPAIRVPALVLHRTGDRICEVEEGRYLAGRIPGVRFVELPGEDHIPWVGDSDSILREIETFTTQTWREVEPDRVLATVMFTDIVGSTTKAAELGDHDWKDLLGEHHARIRSQLSRFRGVEMDTAGDGFFAVFDGPARAINCAKSIHRALAELRLEARIGVHCGECERMNGKVGGLAVHVGARIASMAGPGDVLVSQTVKDLTAGSGLTFDDAGEHELKGVPDRWHLYRVVK